MKTTALQRRLAAQILKVGENKVWMNPTKLEEIKEGITKADVRSYIQKGWIKKKVKQGQSRGRARHTHRQKRKGRRRNPGSRKGAKNARNPQKRAWINRIRVQRSFLKKLRDKDHISPTTYRELYLKAKSGFFRNKDHLRLYAEKYIKKREGEE